MFFLGIRTQATAGAVGPTMAAQTALKFKCFFCRRTGAELDSDTEGVDHASESETQCSFMHCSFRGSRKQRAVGVPNWQRPTAFECDLSRTHSAFLLRTGELVLRVKFIQRVSTLHENQCPSVLSIFGAFLFLRRTGAESKLHTEGVDLACNSVSQCSLNFAVALFWNLFL